MIYFVTASKDASVYSLYVNKNTGLDEILTISKHYSRFAERDNARTFINFDIENINKFDFKSNETEGGYKKSSKFKTKEVLGKLRRVYRIPNSKKEHIKHKGKLITVSEYKILMKLKNKR